MLAPIRERSKTGSDSTAFRESGLDRTNETDYKQSRPLNAPLSPSRDLSRWAGISSSMTGYTKLFGTILASTIWTEDDQTRLVWITMLALANQHGEVEASIPGLAKFANVSIESTEKALTKLMAPDRYSRTKDFEGRRIEELPGGGGWQILNHAKYRLKASEADRKEKTKERVQRHRDREKAKEDVTQCNADVTRSNACNDKQRQSAEAEAKAEEVGSTPLSGECGITGKDEGKGKETGSDQGLDPQGKRGAPQETPHGSPFNRKSLVVPESLNTPEFLDVWRDWVGFRLKKKGAVDWMAMFTKQLSKMEEVGPETSIRVMNDSIMNGWTGLFFDRHQPKKPAWKELDELAVKLKRHPANPNSAWEDPNATPWQKRDFKDEYARYRALGGTEDL